MKKLLLFISILLVLSACTETPDLTENPKLLLTFDNIKYEYQINYPEDGKIWNNDMLGNIEQSKDISIHLPNYPNVMNIKIHDPQDYKSMPDIYDFYKKPFNEFVKNLWEMNKEDTNPNIKNKVISDLKESSINGIKTFQFDLTGSYKSPAGGRVLDEKRTFIFFENNQLVYEINFASKSEEAQELLASFKLTTPSP